jgi:hypothetical protein
MRNWIDLFVFGAIFAVALGAAAPAVAQLASEGVVAASHVEGDAESGDSDSRFDQVNLVRELMRRRGGDPAAVAQLIQLVRPFEPAVAAELFDELAAAHAAVGNLDLAAETRRMLVEQYPAEPRSRAALLWLVRLYASSEVTHAHRLTMASANRAGDVDAERSMALYAANLAGGGEGSPEETRRDATLLFQRAAAARRAGETKLGDGLITALKRARPGDPWGDCARAETWLKEDRETPCPKPIARCVAAATRPKLDGVLDEPWWQGEAALPLRAVDDEAAGGAQSQSDFVRLAYDCEYLYFAASCGQQSDVAYPRDDRRRPHDGELRNHDRVRLLLDADRDYATWFDLTVDSRGWTGDRCWDDDAWNPQWFVAAAQSGAGADAKWVVEAAIPWSALAANAPHQGEAWAVAVDRDAPHSPPQSWLARAADAPRPIAFGLLLFE